MGCYLFDLFISYIIRICCKWDYSFLVVSYHFNFVRLYYSQASSSIKYIDFSQILILSQVSLFFQHVVSEPIIGPCKIRSNSLICVAVRA